MNPFDGECPAALVVHIPSAHKQRKAERGNNLRRLLTEKCSDQATYASSWLRTQKSPSMRQERLSDRGSPGFLRFLSYYTLHDRPFHCYTVRRIRVSF
jgi:hypothetical protein